MKPGESTSSVSIQLTAKQLAQLEKLAAQEGVHRSAIARRAVERYLASAGQGEALVKPQGRTGRSEWEENDDEKNDAG